MQFSIFETLQDVNYYDKRVMIGLSGGINSAAALIYLAEYVEEKPKELYLFYADFFEHSNDTINFVHDLVRYAKKKFDKVIFRRTENSLLDFFENNFSGIPHPSITPCTRILKIEPMVKFMQEFEIELDIVGYVRSEYRRIVKQIDRGVEKKDYLIRHLSDEDCFSLVEKKLGWYPKIYSIKWNDSRIGKALSERGNEIREQQRKIIYEYHINGYNFRSKTYRVFKHNNCLPCKNMHQWELFLVSVFFPDFYLPAIELARKIDSHWGRSNEQVFENSDCAVCAI